MTEERRPLECAFGLRFWGTRGSLPVSGSDYARFGGDTICFEIAIANRRFILDAGSGLRRLGDVLMAAGEGDSTFLFSHLHLDHVIGLTSFAPLFAPGVAIAMHVPDLTGAHPAATLGELFREPFFPIGLDRIPSRLRISPFTPGATLQVNGQSIATTRLRHGAGACGYRFAHGGQALVVLTDHEHEGNSPEPGLVAFCRDADLIVYDAMWDETIDFERHRGWGHSTWQAGLRLLEASGARRLACVHHAPRLPDSSVAEREARLRQHHPESFFAAQDDYVVLRP